MTGVDSVETTLRGALHSPPEWRAPPLPSVVTGSLRCPVSTPPFLPGLSSSLPYPCSLRASQIGYLFSFPCLRVSFWESPNHDICSSLNSQPSLLSTQEAFLSVPRPTLYHTDTGPLTFSGTCQCPSKSPQLERRLLWAGTRLRIIGTAPGSRTEHGIQMGLHSCLMSN